MVTKIVQLAPRQGAGAVPLPPDVWQAQIDLRLAGIERLMRRLEWQVWALVLGGCGMLLVELFDRLAKHGGIGG